MSKEIVVRNEFYPRGLTKRDIFDYYMKNRDKLLNEINGREVMLFVFPSLNNYFVKRKTDDKFIILNRTNFESMLYEGRTVSIHATMNLYEDFGIIDIDYHRFSDARDAVVDVYEYLSRRVSKKQLEIRFTGKTSFHIVYSLQQRTHIDDIRRLLFDILIDISGANYTVGEHRSLNKINLDISSNKFRGGFIVPGALSITGLRCMRLNLSQVKTFMPKDAAI